MKASPHELNTYLKKARGKKTTGIVMTIAGQVIMARGLTVMAASWRQHGIGLSLTGLASTAVGIPLWASGSKRKKKVTQEFEKRARLSFNIAPS